MLGRQVFGIEMKRTPMRRSVRPATLQDRFRSSGLMEQCEIVGHAWACDFGARARP
jgi:hypothetical protein